MTRKRNHKTSVKTTPSPAPSETTDPDADTTTIFELSLRGHDSVQDLKKLDEERSAERSSSYGDLFHHCWRCFGINVLLLAGVIVFIKLIKEFVVNYLNFYFL